MGALASKVQLSVVLVWLCVSSGCWSSHELDGAQAPVRTPLAGAPAPSSPVRPILPGAPRPAASTCRDRRPAGVDPGRALCRAGELEVHCHMGPPRVPCPTTIQEALQLACDESGATHYEISCNACGGTTIHLPLPYAFEIHFDANERFVGVSTILAEPVGPCRQREFIFGDYCAAHEPRTSGSCSEL